MFAVFQPIQTPKCYFYVSKHAGAEIIQNDELLRAARAGMEARIDPSHSTATVPSPGALVGYDDISFPASPQIQLTSVRQPADLIGSTACDLLLGILDGDTTPDRIVFRPELVLRRSTTGRLTE